MMRLVYLSTATDWPSSAELTALLEDARSRNLSQHITGMLLYSNKTYLQLLEGDEDRVRELYGAICIDPRNEGHVILDESGITDRSFPDWNMGFENLENGSPDDLPGFVDVFGGKLDRTIAVNNKTNAIKLLMSFSKQGA